MRGTSIIGLLLAVAVTCALFGGAWLIVHVIRTGEWMAASRWVVVVILGGIVIFRVVARIRRRRAGES
jgi:hypothetical protein